MIPGSLIGKVGLAVSLVPPPVVDGSSSLVCEGSDRVLLGEDGFSVVTVASGLNMPVKSTVVLGRFRPVLGPVIPRPTDVVVDSRGFGPITPGPGVDVGLASRVLGPV